MDSKNQFAKLFEYGNRQILVTKDLTDDGIPCLKLTTTTEKLCSQMSHFTTFDDDTDEFEEQWELVEQAFDAMDINKAIGIVKSTFDMWGMKINAFGDIE